MSERTANETNYPAMTDQAFAILGGGKIAYVKPVRSEDVHKLYPQALRLVAEGQATINGSKHSN